jgi:TnpA family transposase
MPRRSILSAAERESLLALPDTKDNLIRHYTFSDTDLSIIRQRRGSANRLGFAVQLCYMRYPGVMLTVDEEPFSPLLRLVATQLKVPLCPRRLNFDHLCRLNFDQGRKPGF